MIFVSARFRSEPKRFVAGRTLRCQRSVGWSPWSYEQHAISELDEYALKRFDDVKEIVRWTSKFVTLFEILLMYFLNLVYLCMGVTESEYFLNLVYLRMGVAESL